MTRLIFSLIAILLLSVSAIGATLDCKIDENASTVLKNRVETLKKEKVLIGRTAQVTAYVTEKAKDQYEVEVFVPSYELRIYAEGSLESDSSVNHLQTSLWGREALIEVSCKLKH